MKRSPDPPPPARPFTMPVATDIALFGLLGGRLSLLLIRRGVQPFLGRWALPGGLVLADEDLDEAATRELEEETGVRAVSLEQFGAYGAPSRDPRGRVVSIAYVALVRSDQVLRAKTDADAAAWFPVDRLPELAFDHDTIAKDAINTLRNKLDREPVGCQLLPESFSLAELQAVHEAVLGQHLDKRNFRRKVLSEGLVVPVAGAAARGAHRPAQLYRYAHEIPTARDALSPASSHGGAPRRKSARGRGHARRRKPRGPRRSA